MKILMTADPIGGVWQYALELCESMQALGTQVMLATLGGKLSDAQRSDVSRLRHVELRESEYRLEWMSEPWDSLESAGRWLLDLEREFSPSVIHLNHLMHGNLPWRAPVLTVGHSCVFSWWDAVEGRTPTHYDRYKYEVTRSLRAANLICAPTRAMMSALQRHYGPFSRLQVIPNGRVPQRFSPASKEPLILSAGRLWDAAKNVHALDRVALELEWPLFVAGEERDTNGKRERLKGVRCLGSLPSAELAAWYSVASIYALPARYEPFGLTALEAALSGCALVLGDIESLREVWGEAAEYVAPNDHAGLRDKLNALIADPQRRRHLASLAGRRAQHYSMQRCAAHYWSAYESLLAPEGARACGSYSSITH